ncbi:hypothetical protein D0862_14989 [Hortaea werneckii]|uniref:Tyrosine specific protein phosphatases domain-containing protein n=1 Tax=Hortaea werneckii TaxID=91943 RepID=A0A3M7DWE2_HORWE|nr:hypothetical protein D0862_14989 [Hortaea werneckii]
MAAQVCARPAPVPHQPASTTSSQLSINTSQAGTPKAVPHKHIPYCSPGPRPASHQLDTPPASPPSSTHLVETTSLLYPPSGFEKITNEPPTYSISAEKLSQAIDHLATQPLPAAEQVFPWLHGLHPENQLQLAFFTARKKSLRRTPKCIRGLTIVKAGGDLSHSRLKGAIAPDEILYPLKPGRDRKSGDEAADFLDVDPKDGFSVRNFHIQTYEYLQIEAVYPELVALDSEGCIANAAVDFFHSERVEMCSMTAASEISHNVWLGPTPDPSVDLSSSALPSFPSSSSSSSSTQQQQPEEPPTFDIMVEASDIAQIPEPKAFKLLDDLLQRKANAELAENAIPQLEFPASGAILPPTWSQAEVDGLLATCAWIYRQAHTPPSPSCSAASPTSTRRDSKLSLSGGGAGGADADADEDGDIPMDSSTSSPSSPLTTTNPAAGAEKGHRILLHCTDGYTESSLLALAYYMYAEGVPAHTAWVVLHRDLGRNFFAYASDVALLRAIQPRILQSSPRHSSYSSSSSSSSSSVGAAGGGEGGLSTLLCPPTPAWLEKMDGSFPSRVLGHLYLGNLGHANNPGLLRELGIGQVLSVGEPVAWGCGEGEDGGEKRGEQGDEVVVGDDGGWWKRENLMFVDQTQDNGVDPLMGQFGPCLDFIGMFAFFFFSLSFLFVLFFVFYFPPPPFLDCRYSSPFLSSSPPFCLFLFYPIWLYIKHCSDDFAVHRLCSALIHLSCFPTPYPESFPLNHFTQSPHENPLTNPSLFPNTEKGRRTGTSTLVHCRVGVSRSATICIAHVMRHLNLSFPRAYCFVRARRLNVIIQPHLRFVWELMKWEEQEQEEEVEEVQGGEEGEGQEGTTTVGRVRKRELDWPTVCREIAAMNRPYSRQG